MKKSAAAPLLGIVAALIAAAAIFGHSRPSNSKKQTRQIRFSDLDWVVKASSVPAGPGPNLFSGSEQSVFVDQEGSLHLRIRQNRSKWTCAEVVAAKSLGYGTYRFELGYVASLPPNAVLGLFTWSDDPADNHREIDIELSRWGDPTQPNAQFVVQPYDTPGNRVRFPVSPEAAETSHQFDWHSNLTGTRTLSPSRAEPATLCSKPRN